MSNDLSLRADIEAELEFEPSVTAADIGVTVRDGVATLTGQVPTYFEKLAAERAAGRVHGVRAIAEELEVELPFHVKHDDTEIARRASNILEWSSFPSVKADHVKVAKGWVTLSGEVEWQFQREAAINAVRRLAGVVGIINLITVRSRVPSGDVKDHIRRAFERSAELEASGINVSVEGGKVSLSGKIRSWRDRRAAESAAWAMPSVTQVVDNLTVAFSPQRHNGDTSALDRANMAEAARVPEAEAASAAKANNALKAICSDLRDKPASGVPGDRHRPDECSLLGRAPG